MLLLICLSPLDAAETPRETIQMLVCEALLKWAKRGEKLILRGESCTPEGVQESRNVYKLDS